MTNFDQRLAYDCARASEVVYDDPRKVAKELGFDRLDVIEEGPKVGPSFYSKKGWLGQTAQRLIGPQLPVAILGSNRERVLLVFRGSLPPLSALKSLSHCQNVLRDWFDGNFDFALTEHEAWPGRVANGFATVFNAMWPELERLLPLHLDRSKKLYVTGHSLGGALATLAPFQLKKLSCVNAVDGVYVFGSPMVGNGKFHGAYDRPLYRFELGADVVPVLPLSMNVFSSTAENAEYLINGGVSLWRRLTGKKAEAGKSKFNSNYRAYRPTGTGIYLMKNKWWSDGGDPAQVIRDGLVRLPLKVYRTVTEANLLQCLKDHDIEAYRKRIEALR